METSKQVLGSKHPDTLCSISSLARTWNKMNKTQDAITLMAEYLELRQKLLGSNHPRTLSSRHTLRKWQKALELTKASSETTYSS